MGVPQRQWPIYASKRMVDILPQLCALGERHTVVANVIFHCFGSSNVMCPRLSEYFRHSYLQTLNYAYSDKSFLELPLSNSIVDNAREILFSPMNKELVKEVSPAIRPQPLAWLHENIEDSLSRFAKYNTRSKEYVCINGLYHAVGAEQFMKAVKLMRLHHKFTEQIKAEVVNQFFMDTLSRNSEMAQIEAMDMAMFLMQRKNVCLYSPFVAGSWRPLDVLLKIVKEECSIAFNHFFSFAPQRIKEQAYAMLHTTDPVTGLLQYPWGYMKVHSITNVEQVAVPSSGTVPVEDSSLSVKPMNAQLVDTIFELGHCLKALKRHSHNEMGWPLLAVHVEQDSITLATEQEVFTIDILVTDPLYHCTVFSLLSWVWANARIVKVGHRILPKIAKVSAVFNRPFTSFANIIDLVDQRRKQYDNGTVRFKETGFSKTLNGLLQEYNIAGMHIKAKWDTKNRPIADDRLNHMASIAKGLMEIERSLREDGWMPTEFCEVEPSTNSSLCDQLEEDIFNAQL